MVGTVKSHVPLQYGVHIDRRGTKTNAKKRKITSESATYCSELSVGSELEHVLNFKQLEIKNLLSGSLIEEFLEAPHAVRPLRTCSQKPCIHDRQG